MLVLMLRNCLVTEEHTFTYPFAMTSMNEVANTFQYAYKDDSFHQTYI